MFQLFEFLASHFGTAIITVLQDTIYGAMALTDCDECGFNDLGKLLFGGLVVALIVGILVSVLRWRVQGETQSSDFISIRPTNRNS
jgi:hypothetical protein